MQLGLFEGGGLLGGLGALGGSLGGRLGLRRNTQLGDVYHSVH